MSRIGKKPIEIPSGVTVTINDNTVTVKGPKGELTKTFHPDLTITQEENIITVTRPSDSKEHRMIHGTSRSLLANMIEGVAKGYQKPLNLLGLDIVRKSKEINLF